MAGGMVLREVFTRLGFETDPMSLKRYEEAIASTQKTMSALGQTAADMGGRLSAALSGASALAREGSDVQQVATAFESLGGTAEELDKLRELSSGLVPDSTLQRAANLGKLFKLPAEQIPNLLKIAQGASVALGTSVEKNLEDVFVAMARQSKLIADNLGTQMGSLDDINAAYAKRNNLNAKALTDDQKAAAFIEAFVEKSDRQAALADKAAQNQFALMDAQMKNLRDKAGLILNAIFGAIIRDFMSIAGGPLNKLINGFERWWSSAENVERVLRRVVMVARVLVGVLGAAGAAKGMELMVTQVWGLVKGIRMATMWSALLKSLWLAIPLLIAAVGLLIEDVMVWLRGGDSLIGRFIKKYQGSNGPAGKVARWLVSIKPQIAALAVTVQGWVAKARGWLESAGAAVRATIPPIRAAIAASIKWVTPYAKAAYAWLREAIPAAIRGVIDAAKLLWGWLKGAVGWLVDTTPGAISVVVDAAIWLWEWIKRVAVAVADAAVVAWGWISRTAQVIGDAAAKVGRWVWSVLEDLWTAFGPWIYGIWKLIEGVGQLVWHVIKGVAGGLWEAMQGVWAVLKAIGVFLWENIPPALDVIVQAARVVWHGVLLIVEWVGKAFAALATGAQWLLDKVGLVVEWILLAVAGMAGGLVKVAGDIVGWVIEKLSGITAWILNAIASVGGWIADGLESFNNGVGAFVAWLDTALVQPIQKLFSAIGGVVKGVFDTIGKWIQPVIDLIDATLGKAYRAAEVLGLADSSKEVNALIDQQQRDVKDILARGQQVQAWQQGGQLEGVSRDAIEQFIRTGKGIEVGQLQVNIQGNTNMGAQDIATATKSGVTQGLGDVGRDLQVGGN